MRSRGVLLSGFALALGIMFLGVGVLKAQEPSSKRQVVGFYWVYDDGTAPYRTVSQNTDAISDLCPTWMNVTDAEGTIKVQKDPKITEFAKQKGINLYPLIANEGFKPKPFHWILVSPARREKLINNMISALDSYGCCKGINLDFEGLDPKDRELYNDFLKLLSEKLHARSYQLTIDVPSKTYDNPKSSWAGAFDYAEINKYCDQIMIMTYDEHWSGGPAGPIASVEFVEKCLQYATSVIPKEKIILGIPFYGYDWPENGKARGAQYSSIVTRISRNAAKVQWDDKAKAPWFCYADADGKKRTCWFENKDSLAAKLELGTKYDVGGICIWSLGDEDPGNWDVIRSFRKR